MSIKSALSSRVKFLLSFYSAVVVILFAANKYHILSGELNPGWELTAFLLTGIAIILLCIWSIVITIHNKKNINVMLVNLVALIMWLAVSFV